MNKIIILLVSVSLLSTGGCASIAKGLLRSALGIKSRDEDRLTTIQLI